MVSFTPLILIIKLQLSSEALRGISAGWIFDAFLYLTESLPELREARALAESGDEAGVCSAVARAVTDFIGNRWDVQARGMTLGEIETVLRNGGAEEQLVSNVREILSDCDLGRFAAGEGTVESGHLIAEADECLRSIERLSARRRRR